MERTKLYYEILNTIVPDINYEKWESIVEAILKIRRLALKHHRLAEMSCNGVGWVRGQCYYNGSIDDYAKRQYGAGVKSAYVSDDVDIFTVEQNKIETKINKIASTIGAKVIYQGDPRGATVKLVYNNREIFPSCI